MTFLQAMHASRQRQQHPEPKKLKRGEHAEPGQRHRPIPADKPEPGEPGGMKRHDQRVVPGARLHRASRKKTPGVARGKCELAEALQRHEGENRGRKGHAALFRDTQLAVKPGPMAVMSARFGVPVRRKRSSTKSTVGADMFPQSASTSRS